jgi:hypothetical protein
MHVGSCGSVFALPECLLGPLQGAPGQAVQLLKSRLQLTLDLRNLFLRFPNPLPVFPVFPARNHPILSNIPDPAVILADFPGFLFLRLHRGRLGAKSAESKQQYWKRVEGGNVAFCLQLCPVSDLIWCKSEDQLTLRVPDLIYRG